MLKIFLCCGGGFSSSYLTQKMQQEIVNKGLSEEVSIDFYPFQIVSEIIDNYDIVLCCPHLNIYVKNYVKANDVHIPFYVLPPRMYGVMEFDELYAEAKDILDKYIQDPTNNPFVFPGEENNLRVTRNKAHIHTK